MVIKFHQCAFSMILAAAIVFSGLAISGGDDALAASNSRSAKASKSKSRRSRRTTILLKVNDDIITTYDVKQRAAFLVLQSRQLQASAGKAAKANFGRMLKSSRTRARFEKMREQVIAANRGKTREQLIKILRAKQRKYALGLQRQAMNSARGRLLGKVKRKALNELIEERLKIQNAKSLGVTITNETVNEVLTKIAGRNKKTIKQFAADLARSGTNIGTMRERMRANFAWRRAINRRYGALVAINDAQIDNVIASATAKDSNSNVQLQLQRITLKLSGDNDQGAMARRFSEADRMQKRFRNCKSMNKLVKGVKGARFQKLGLRRPDTVPEPTRTMLLSASDGQITPPALTDTGIEFYAVCGRRAGKGSLKERAAAKGSLRQKEFEIMARRHMLDIRREATICRRQSAAYAMTFPPCN